MHAIVRLSGGLGNQFFQLAFGNHLKEALQVHVIYDDSFYHSGGIKITKRRFFGDVILPNGVFRNFHITDVENQFGKFHSKKSPIIGALFTKITLPIYFFVRYGYVIHFRFKNLSRWRLLGNLVHHVYLGSWQDCSFVSTSFCDEVTKVLDRSFETPRELEISKLIGIHVRRGDYITPQSIYANLPVEYYTMNVEELAKDTRNLSVLVFSDDVEWCKSNLDLPNFCFYARDFAKDEFSEFLLMSKLDFLIIANSSFSFAAALIGNPNKIVIAPSLWFSLNSVGQKPRFPIEWVIS